MRDIPTVGALIWLSSFRWFVWILSAALFLFTILDYSQVPVSAIHEPCHHEESQAREEGVVNLFTTMPEIPANQVREWAVQQMPYLKVNLRRFRTDSELLAATSTGGDGADVVLSSLLVAVELKSKAADYPCPQHQDEYPSSENRADKVGSWTAFGLIPRVLAYNTSLHGIEKANTLKELISRKELIGKITVPIEDVFWFYGLENSLGKETFRRTLTELRQTKPILIRESGTALNSLLAGESLVALGINPWSILSSREKGAPLDYIHLGPAVTSAYTLMGLKNSPHPNAGRGLIKQLLRRTNQERIISLRRYVPANKMVATGLPKLRQENLLIPDPVGYQIGFRELRAEYTKILQFR